jgi:3-deoxy-7-phosphoheptulonate synthase
VTLSYTSDTTEESGVVVAGLAMGAGHPLRVIAGPCSVESYEQFRTTALAVRDAGADLLRGGAFKPRTSPYSFQGLGLQGLEIMRSVADEIGMGIVTEAMAPEDIELVADYADMIQIGARNMDNSALLASAASAGRPILLKRGITASIEEVLVAAETIAALGNSQIAICERGSRTFEPAMRNSLDIGAIPELRFRSGLPVVVDSSHGTGRTDLVLPVGLAGIAAGADGMMVEVHPDPSVALSDGFQAIETADFPGFMSSVRALAGAVGRAA